MSLPIKQVVQDFVPDNHLVLGKAAGDNDPSDGPVLLPHADLPPLASLERLRSRYYKPLNLLKMARNPGTGLGSNKPGGKFGGGSNLDGPNREVARWTEGRAAPDHGRREGDAD